MKNKIISCVIAIMLAACAFSAVADTTSDVAGLVSQVTDCDPDTKHTAPARDVTDRLCREVLDKGNEGVRALVDMIVEPDVSGDYKARYLLHAMSLYVTEPKREKDRKLLGDVLISKLGSDAGANVKAFVAAEIHFLQDERAVEALGKLLLQEATCDFAARALVVIEKGAAGQLSKALSQVDGRRRLSVIQALGDVRDTGSVKELEKFLASEGVDERVTAATALSRISDKSSVKALTDAFGKAKDHERIKLADRCFDLAANLVDAGKKKEALELYRQMWNAMKDETAPHVRRAVVTGLASGYKDESMDDLIKKLKSEDTSTKGAVLYVLRARRDVQSFDAVAEAMKDADPGVRLMATTAIGAIDGEKSIPMLIANLPGKNIEEAQTLRTTLIGIKSEKADAIMAKSLAAIADGDNASDVRIMLLGVAASRKAEASAAATLQLIKNSDSVVSLTAIKAMEELAPGSYAADMVEILPSLEDSTRIRAFEDALTEMCRRASKEERAAALGRAVRDGDAKQRSVLLNIAGRVGTDDTMDLLFKAYEDSNEEIKTVAIRCLSGFPSGMPCEKLLEVAKSEDNEKYRIIALRGYIDLAEKGNSEIKRVEMLEKAISAAIRSDEKKQALGKLGRINMLESLQVVLPCAEIADTSNEAVLAALSIIDRIDDRYMEETRKALELIVDKAPDEQNKNRARGVLKKRDKQ